MDEILKQLDSWASAAIKTAEAAGQSLGRLAGAMGNLGIGLGKSTDPQTGQPVQTAAQEPAGPPAPGTPPPSKMPTYIAIGVVAAVGFVIALRR